MSKKNAVMLILLGGTFMSFVGLYMRLLTDANGFQILFYRSLSLCAIVGNWMLQLLTNYQTVLKYYQTLQ